MGDGWELKEGALRGKRRSDGEWEFFEVVELDPVRGPEEFPLDVSNATEARRIASRTERSELERYAEYRRQYHAVTSFNQSGWVGDVLEKPTANFLIDEFEIDVEQLTPLQLAQLERDVLSIDLILSTEAKQRAKKDLVTTRKAKVQLTKQQGRIEALSRGFRAMEHFSPFAAPEVTLARLLFELSENEKSIGEFLDQIGHDKSNITAITLCENAIDLFLRWGDKEVPEEERGMKYSPRLDQMATLSKVEGDTSVGIPARFTGPLGEFLEEIQFVLSQHGQNEWNFGVHEPARKALSRFEKRQQNSREPSCRQV